jgi:hypothetical protein
VEHFFRHEIRPALRRADPVARRAPADLVEDVVQAALVRALET